MKNVVVIDGNALLFKAYFATAYTGNLMKNADGVATNAIYAFINMITKIEKEYNFDYLLVAFDASKKNFRHEQYKAYKGTRSSAPEELVVQFPLVREFLNLYGIANYEIDGYEADDIIGTIAKQCKVKGYSLEIITSDKDLLQLVAPNITCVLAKKGITEVVKVTVDNFSEIWDIEPKQVIDLKGLMGDASDNIPGVKGVGEKTAIKLIKEYKSIESLYDNIDSIKGKMQEKLINGKDDAFMSKDLATIIVDIELPFKIEELVIANNDLTKLKDFYYRYELKTFLNRLNEKTNNTTIEFRYQEVSVVPEKYLQNSNFIKVLSLEENYHVGQLHGLIIINEKDNLFININNLINDKKLLNYLKSDIKKITYDIKKLLVILNRYGIEINHVTDDVMIGSYLLNCNVKLDAEVLIDTIYNVSTLSNKKLLKETLEIAVESKVKQAFYLNKLFHKNKVDLKMSNSNTLYELELKLAIILTNMELEGILIDKDYINVLKDEYEIKCNELEAQIYSFVNKEFNINSIKQLGIILFEELNLPVVKKTKTGYSTDNDVLTFLIDEHPIISLIIEYRTYKKLLSTYVLPMPDYILADGRIHTIYNQCLTATGRLSSKEPNLQNIATKSPERKKIKKIFIAKEGYSLVSFDYSQIELRILASFSNDPVFIDAFSKDEDIHQLTAARVADVALKDVTSEQRKAAKAINFGIVYGISDFGLANQLKISRQSAKEFIDKYYVTYPNIKSYLDSLVNITMETGYSTTILNRRRYIEEIKSNNYNIKENGKRMAMNTPIQGSGADILKLAMIKVNEYLIDKINAKILLQVHDELIFEVKDDFLEAFINDVKEIMENVYPLSVKLKVNSASGKKWFDI